MGNLVPFNASAGVPAHIARRAAAAAAANTDLSTGVGGGFGVLSFRGKIWRLSKSGVAEVIMNPETGESRQSLELILVKANPDLSKVFYLDGYQEGSSEKPDCYSNNGRVPEQDSPKLQAQQCATCPHNQWGSKVSDQGTGKGKACADVRRIAVATVAEPEELMLLRVPAASLKELVLYSGILNRRQIPYNMVVTRVSFDVEKAYPALQFMPVGLLDEVTADKVDEVMQTEMVSSILASTTLFEASDPAAAATPVQAPPPKMTREQEIEAALGGMGQVETAAAPAATATKPRATRAAKATTITPDDVAAAIEPTPAAQPGYEFVGDAFSNMLKEPVDDVLAEVDGDEALNALLAGLDDD